MVRVLLVDDNTHVRKLMDICLKREGFEVLHADNGAKALDLLHEHFVDLIVADIMMPQMDGYELTRELRQAGIDLPILMVTAKETYSDKKMGFEIGADDYMTKPVDMAEMVLRVKALLRRAKINSEKKLTVGDMTLSVETLEVCTPSDTFVLPKKEFYLLFKLLAHPKKIFTRQELMDDIWGFDTEADERTVDVHIKRLRDKFAQFPQFEIITVRGLGYKAERHV